MGAIRTTFAVLAVGTALGCTSPELARVSWSDELATALPVAEKAVERGTLVVTTEPATRREEWDPARRGFAVFDASGKLLLSEKGCPSAETLRLAPGRYVLVSLVGQGFERKLASIQAVVEAGMVTEADFTRPLAAAAPARGAAARP